MDIRKLIKDSSRVQQNMLENDEFMQDVQAGARMMVKVFSSGGRVMLCGNGGSAADAQHIAAELSGRFYYDRKPLNAEALHVNTSFLTAVANDFGFADVYARMVEASGKPGDLLIGISTSGNSENVVRAFGKAAEKGIKTLAMTGDNGGEMAKIADAMIRIPSEVTPRIQEAHILVGHILCQWVEEVLFPEKVGK